MKVAAAAVGSVVAVEAMTGEVKDVDLRAAVETAARVKVDMVVMVTDAPEQVYLVEVSGEVALVAAASVEEPTEAVSPVVVAWAVVVMVGGALAVVACAVVAQEAVAMVAVATVEDDVVVVALEMVTLGMAATVTVARKGMAASGAAVVASGACQQVAVVG